MPEAQTDSLAQLQKLYQEMMEPLEKTQLKHGIYQRVRMIDERLLAVKELSGRWAQFAAAVDRAAGQKRPRDSVVAELAGTAGKIVQEYEKTLPLLDHPHCGKGALHVCRKFVSFDAIAGMPPDHLQKLQKSCHEGAQLLKDFQEFLLGVRRKVVSMNRLRYAFEYYAEFNWRRALPAIAAVVLLFLVVWGGFSYYLGGAAPVGFGGASRGATGVVTDMSPAAAARTSSTEALPPGRVATLTMRGIFGGTSDLVITAEGMRWEHKRWAKPGGGQAVLVDQTEWRPAWAGKVSDPFVLKSPVLPGPDVTVNKLVGRGTVTVTAASDQQVVIRFTDSGFGADTYAVSIQIVQPPPKPAPAAGDAKAE